MKAARMVAPWPDVISGDGAAAVVRPTKRGAWEPTTFAILLTNLKVGIQCSTMTLRPCNSYAMLSNSLARLPHPISTEPH